MSNKLLEKDNSGKSTRQQSLEYLSSVFDYDISVIENALDDAGGDLELAMDSLLNSSSQEMKQEEIPLASEIPGDDATDLSLPQDDALARELAAQFNVFNIDDEEIDDAELARRLQDEWNNEELARRLQDEWNNEDDEHFPVYIPFSEKTLSDEVFLQYLHDSPPIDELFVFYSIFWIILLI